MSKNYHPSRQPETTAKGKEWVDSIVQHVNFLLNTKAPNGTPLLTCMPKPLLTPLQFALREFVPELDRVIAVRDTQNSWPAKRAKQAERRRQELEALKAKKLTELADIEAELGALDEAA